MTKLEKYADEIIEEIKTKNELTEDELIRFIYFSLGKKVVFDLDWVFGDEYTKRNIYYKPVTPELLDNYEQDEKWPMICKGISYIMSYIGKKVGLNIEVVKDEPDKQIPFPHIYNKVTKKDGSFYNLDLYLDLPNIYMNQRTEFFGFTNYALPRVFTRKQLEEMDYKLGYITDKKGYTDEYYYLLKDYTSRLDSIYEKMNVILENPSPYKDFDLEYEERKRYIINTIRYILWDDDDKYWRWEWLDCYYIKDNKMIPKEIIYLIEDNNTYFYEYNLDNKNFNQISIDNLSKMISNGLKFPERCESEEYTWLYELDNIKNSK